MKGNRLFGRLSNVLLLPCFSVGIRVEGPFVVMVEKPPKISMVENEVTVSFLYSGEGFPPS